MRSYNDLNLPDFTSFRTERVEMPKRVKPRALDTRVIAAINAAAPELSMNDPAVYVAFLMFSRLGLRNIDSMRGGTGLRMGAIGIIERRAENF